MQNLSYIHSNSTENRFWPELASMLDSWMNGGLIRTPEDDLESGWSCSWLIAKPWTALGVESMVEAMKAKMMVLVVAESRPSIRETILRLPPMSH